MQGKDRFCCVSCGGMFVIQEADLLFRTGFFRGIHPLGCCKACSPTLSREDVLECAETMSGQEKRNVLHIPTNAQYNDSTSVPEVLYTTNYLPAYS